MKTTSFTLTLILLLALLPVSNSRAEKLTALQIMENVYNRPEGKDRTSDLKMTLINKFGDERVRSIRQFGADLGKVEKNIMFFLAPADVKQTSFMNWSYDEPGKDDDQWFYLPALRKIKRISSESKGDYFMGSDFTYDDLGDRRPDEDTHTLLRTDTVDGKDYYVVESVPKEEDYMYSKTITWVATNGSWIGLTKEFYDEDGELLKVLSVDKVEQIQGYWTILQSTMHNVQNDHKTVMELSKVKYDTGIKESMFTERMMKRGL
ncbi:outer membrane lipoprotein-sorting protein [bacterium]|nr:outer membrane lipoprotein-sorting protein [bacterium]